MGKTKNNLYSVVNRGGVKLYVVGPNTKACLEEAAIPNMGVKSITLVQEDIVVVPFELKIFKEEDDG